MIIEAKNIIEGQIVNTKAGGESTGSIKVTEIYRNAEITELTGINQSNNRREVHYFRNSTELTI